MKTCTKCGESKSEDTSNFYKNNQCKGGLSTVCKTCMKLQSDKWRTDNPSKSSQIKQAYKARNPEKHLFDGAQSRAKERGLPFDLELKDIVIPDVCPVLGIKLARCKGQMCDTSPSLDQFVPGGGYIKTNIRVISMRANRLKGDGTVEELELIAKYMRSQ